MPRNASTAKKIISTHEQIRLLTQNTEIDSLTLLLHQTALATHLALAENLVESLDEEAPAEATNPEPKEKAGWFKRQIDKRIEKKCQRYLDAEINRLQKLRQEKNPNSDELDMAYIRETLQKVANSFVHGNENYIRRNRIDTIFYNTVGAIFLIAAVAVAAATEGAALPITLGVWGLFFGGAGAMSLRRLLRFKKELEKALEPTMKEMEKFVVSDKSFSQILEESIRRADRLLKETTRQNDPMLHALNTMRDALADERQQKKKKRRKRNARLSKSKDGVFANDSKSEHSSSHSSLRSSIDHNQQKEVLRHRA